MNKLLYLATFAVGGVIGSLGTFYYLNRKFQQDLEKEITAYKEMHDSNEEIKNERPEPEPEPEPEPIPEETVSYEKIVSSYIPKEKEEPNMNNAHQIDRAKLYLDPIRIIDEEQYGNGDYDIELVTYYEDGLLADENDDLFEDAEDIIGREALMRLQDPDDDVDVLYIRNDQMLKDYEVFIYGDDCPYAI